MERIIECVPNFSEGRNMEVINSIVSAIEKSGGVKVLDVDPGEATNRTVVTFVGSPEAVVEAAFQGVKCAGELIDMRHHHGAHPRSELKANVSGAPNDTEAGKYVLTKIVTEGEGGVEVVSYGWELIDRDYDPAGDLAGTGGSTD